VRGWPAAVCLAALAACGGDSERAAAPTSTASTEPPATTTSAPTTVPTTVAPAPTTAPPTTARPVSRPARTTAPPATAGRPYEVVTVAYRVEVRTPDPQAASFPEIVEATLSDPRGWERAAFQLERRDDGPHLIVIAEGDEVDRLCLPYDTYGEYSCQNGPVVAINAERWREATPKWTGDLATYRQMVVNHEVGHLLGQKHPKPQCPRRGEPAPVMNQQSTELDGCLPNPWPLQWEVDKAARHDRPIAPGYER
jgi:hypothetical protein